MTGQSTLASPITQTSAVTNISAESRAHKLNIAGLEVEGVSIAGQVRIKIWNLSSWNKLYMLSYTDVPYVCRRHALFSQDSMSFLTAVVVPKEQSSSKRFSLAMGWDTCTCTLMQVQCQLFYLNFDGKEGHPLNPKPTLNSKLTPSVMFSLCSYEAPGPCRRHSIPHYNQVWPAQNVNKYWNMNIEVPSA
jgi:hypothetical protein